MAQDRRSIVSRPCAASSKSSDGLGDVCAAIDGWSPVSAVSTRARVDASLEGAQHDFCPPRRGREMWRTTERAILALVRPADRIRMRLVCDRRDEPNGQRTSRATAEFQQGLHQLTQPEVKKLPKSKLRLPRKSHCDRRPNQNLPPNQSTELKVVREEEEQHTPGRELATPNAWVRCEWNGTEKQRRRGLPLKRKMFTM
ncbi:unnamed protein product, partial [Mesorhabditis spiculigera]